MMQNRELIYSNPGDEIRIDYAPRVQPDGTIELEPSGKFNLQEWYNSQAAGCDMHLIVQRYLSGDTDVLSRVQGVGFDATAYPKTYAEMLQRVIDGQRLFDSLPPDVRRDYDNDFNQFFAAAGADDFYTRLMDRLNPVAAQQARSDLPGDADASTS